MAEGISLGIAVGLVEGSLDGWLDGWELGVTVGSGPVSSSGGVIFSTGSLDGLSEALGAELGRKFEKGCFTGKACCIM